MSNFAAHSYYTMPAIHSLRNLPLSPPETDQDSSHNPQPSFLGAGADLDGVSAGGHYLGISGERSRFQPRRTSTLSYQNPGARDSRDRSNPRNPRNLVVVIPPPDFPLEQGHLGNVLSMGPRHRLPHGILMPLFPTMFGQLNAIAREYNFPSTIGLCLYLHINENGITMTPRISDDSWQYLFGHLFDARPASSGYQLPIGGNIEFDIDLNKARWFDSWLSGSLRDPDPAFPPAAASQTSWAAHHWRGESRITNADEQPFEERWDVSGSQTVVANSRPETLRHLPRKLSLVDRLESQAGHKSHNQHDSPPETQLIHALSPIPQSAVPHTAKSDLERRVNSWRESAELYPVSMQDAYKPAPDLGITAVVTTMDEYALDRNFRPAINLDEHHWSVTSAGPNDPVIDLLAPSSRPSSVHLDRRANGSVPLTPSTATSWGPADYEWPPAFVSITRLPSPDLGERMIEDTEAPRLRAVWENSFGWRTAVTWRDVYPYSATHAKPAVEIQLRDSRGLLPQYPNLIIYPPVSPHLDFEYPKSFVRSVWGGSFGWQKAATWRNVWPYSTPMLPSALPVQFRSSGNLEFTYPNLSIYPAVYPFLEIYPHCTVEDVSQPVSVTLRGSTGLVAMYPNLVIYPAVYPHLDIYPPVVEVARMKVQELVDTKLFLSHNVLSNYPNLVIYPAVYPHFGLYPSVLEVSETTLMKEVAVRLVNAHSIPSRYPNLIIYPSVYPYLDIYPAQEERMHTSSVVWSMSFGWKSAKTWLKVYPFHCANTTATRRHDSADSAPVVRIQGRNLTRAEPFAGKQAVWGTSLGWNIAATWRMVWPTSGVQMKPDVSPTSVRLAGPGGLPSEYPHLVIYPAAYPYFDIYPPCVSTAEVTESQDAKYERPVSLVPHYPNLVIYPAVYPHLDIYPPFAKALIISDHEKGRRDLRRRRIEAWRAKTAAQVGLVELLTNNHNWEADKPLEVDLGDYAWSVTSAGPSTSILQVHRTQYYPPSVHLDRRVGGSVLLTPSTATTWGPQDDDWYSDIASIERLPSPDIGQRVLDDDEDPGSPLAAHALWRLVWPFFRGDSQTQTLALSSTVFEAHYPNLVIYPAAYPHFDLYPARLKTSALECRITESLVQITRYPVLDIYPAVYPYFNIYPAVEPQTDVPRMPSSDVQDEQVDVRLPALYPNLDIYYACYPFNLDCIYPAVTLTELNQITVETPSGYPCFVVYPPVYPFVTPYPSFTAEIRQPSRPIQLLPVSQTLQSVSVRLAAQYPILDLYPAGYPWCLESIYPAISIDACSTSHTLPSWYPCIEIYPSVYPFVQPYPQMTGMRDSSDLPGSLDKAAYTRAQGLLAMAESKPMDPYPAGYPHFDLYPAMNVGLQQRGAAQDPAVSHRETLPRPRSAARRERKTHMELHASVFRSLEKQPARCSKTHTELHDEVFQDGVVWTPSGYMQDLTSLTPKRREDPPAREQRRRPPPISEVSTVRPSRSRSGTLTGQSPDNNIVFPLGQPAALPPLPPLRVRSPGVSSQPSPAVSETPTPRVSPSSTHTRTTSSRLSQAVRSMMPGVQRRNSSAALVSPPADEQKERAKDRQSPTRFLSLVDRRPTVVPPLPHTNTSEFLTRAPQVPQKRESLVLQRARAYEQSNVNQSSSTKGTLSSFTLPPLPPIPPMSELTETIEKSKITFS